MNGQLTLVKGEKIPAWDKRSLWAQEDRNRKAMLDLFGLEYPEVERPVDDEDALSEDLGENPFDGEDDDPEDDE